MPVSTLQVFTDTVVPLVPPDAGWIVWFDINKLELMDSQIGAFPGGL